MDSFPPARRCKCDVWLARHNFRCAMHIRLQGHMATVLGASQVLGKPRSIATQYALLPAFTICYDPAALFLRNWTTCNLLVRIRGDGRGTDRCGVTRYRNTLTRSPHDNGVTGSAVANTAYRSIFTRDRQIPDSLMDRARPIRVVSLV